MQETMTFTSNSIYRNKSPKVFDSSNSIYASAKMSGFKQQNQMNGTIDSVGLTKRGYL